MPGTSAAVALQKRAESVRNASSESAPGWYLFFFISGFPALLYQIVWQRSLFTLYGVNIESVTMVVTAFMLGLGLGGLMGGLISRKKNRPLLAVFGVAELLIASYGVASLRIFHWAANFTSGSGPVKTGLVAFTLIVVPTLLMGSTLPILVAYRARVSRNVGTSVGALYAVNTLGSATACFCAGLFLMQWLGQSKSVGLAAALNAIVGGSVLLWQFKNRQSDLPDPIERTTAEQINPATESAQTLTFNFGVALMAACVSGFVSLGYEIIWYRLFSFTTGGEAKSFAFLLGAYLMGIGAGSLAINRLCQKITRPLAFTRFLVGAVFAANLLGFLIGPILFELVQHVSYLWTLIPIGIAAACLGSIFPLLCHVSISASDEVGARMSYVYLSNIIGSVLGSYITGFVLMDVFSLRQVSVILTLVGIALGVFLLPKARFTGLGFASLSGAALLLAFLLVKSSHPLFHHMYEKMMMKGAYRGDMQFAATVETRSGDITVRNGTVYGGGIYDGRFNVSLVDDSNGIQRPFALSYFHTNPRAVLIIGLSSGSWAQVVASHPEVEGVEIVEINPGYLRLIQNVPAVSSLLTNPKVHIEIDDGRRWLVRNPERKFDAVVMNTTYNWRSNASNLLSVEFLQLVRKHLNAGGIAIYNTTESPEALATGVSVFPCAMRIGGFLVVSDSPLQLNAERWHDNLLHYMVNDKPVFDLSKDWDRMRFEQVMAMTLTTDRDVSYPYPLESAEHIRARTAHARIITDDNMGTEWSR